MFSPKWRAAVGLGAALLALAPPAVMGQCQHSPMRPMTAPPPMGQMCRPPATGSLRLQVPPLFVAPPELQWVALQQVQMLTRQRLQRIVLQPPAVPVQPPPALALQKQNGALLEEMKVVQQKLEGLLQAAQRNDVPAPEATALQQEVNALQQKVDALVKPPTALLDEMSSLHRETDELLQHVTASPADVIAAVRASH